MVYGLWFRSSFFWEGVGEEGRGGGGCASFPGSHKPKKEAKIGRSQLYNLRSDQRTSLV